MPFPTPHLRAGRPATHPSELPPSSTELPVPRTQEQADKYFRRVAKENALPSRFHRRLAVAGWVVGGGEWSSFSPNPYPFREEYSRVIAGGKRIDRLDSYVSLPCCYAIDSPPVSPCSRISLMQCMLIRAFCFPCPSLLVFSRLSSCLRWTFLNAPVCAPVIYPS